MSLHLPDFSAARLLVVGDVMLDRYWYGDAGRISPEAPVPVVHVQRREERAGGAGNGLTAATGALYLVTCATASRRLTACGPGLSRAF